MPARCTRASILGVRIRDLTGGFRCIRREVLETVGVRTLRSQGYVFNIELTYRALTAGFRVAEMPITFRDRIVGDSKISLRDRDRGSVAGPGAEVPLAGSALAGAQVDGRRPSHGSAPGQAVSTASRPTVT